MEPTTATAANDGKRPADDDQHQHQQQHLRETSSDKTPGAPQPKRRRVADNARVRSAKACQRCRRLKEKCDGQQPCQRCVRSGRDCEFAPAGVTSGGGSSSGGGAAAAVKPEPSSLRGGRPSSLASGAAASSSSVAADAHSARTEERTRCLERLVQHLLGDVPMDLNNLRRMAEKASQRTGAVSDDGGARAGTEDLDDLTLEDENFTVKTLSQSTAHYSGEFSHWNFSQKLRRRLSQCLDSDVAVPALKRDLRAAAASSSSSSMPPPPPGRAAALSTKGPGMRVLEYWRATQLQSPKTLVQSVLGCLPPRGVANFLVHIYFQFAQVNCFYVEEHWLRKKLGFLYEAPGHVTSEDSTWVCSVLMVLAIGTQFAHMAAGPPPKDAAADNPDDLDGAAAAAALQGGSDSEVGVTFYQMASKLIPDVITVASMESVQACLLLAHYALPLDTQGLAYTYLGLGIKMAIQNGMHRRYTGADLDVWTVETRNRLWWTAYMVERRVSVLHGRPASIALTEVDAELPKDLPEFRKHDEPSKFGNMSALIDMTLRLGDVSNAITLLRRCPKNLQPTYFERVVDICQSLEAWWASLPAEVQNPTPSSPLFRSSAHLKLSLHLTDIFVGRPFIFSQTTGSSPGSVSSPGAARRPDTSGSDTTTTATATAPTTTTNTTSTSSTATTTTRPRNRAGLVARAVDAAISITALLRTLHETTGLARSSYTEFSSCRAALLVMLAQSVNGPPQPPQLKAAVELGMQLIRRMAAGNVSTQSETSVIEALEIAVRRLMEMQAAEQLQMRLHHGEGRLGPGGARGRHGCGCCPGGGDDAGQRAGIRRRGDADASKTGYERFREWASLWPAGSSSNSGGGGSGGELGQAVEGHRGIGYGGRSTAAMDFADLKTTPASAMGGGGGGGAGMVQAAGGGAMHEHDGAEYSPESTRWLNMMDTGVMGVGIEQLDDLGLFGGFPELGALDGWPGLV